MTYVTICETCGREISENSAQGRCDGCPGKFDFRYDYAAVTLPDAPRDMWDYAALLPVMDRAGAISLGEGGTPLLASRQDVGCRLFWKIEALNPTGSHKDRALSLTVTKAVELGFARLVIASTGSAGLACAAYAARAGLPCIVLVPDGTPRELLLPMHALGATIVEMQGTFVQIESLLSRLTPDDGWFDATTRRASNPYHAEAPKTIAYEIVSALGSAPDWVVVPVGGGATLFGIWRGFLDLRHLGVVPTMPKLAAVQPRDFNALEIAMRDGLAKQEELEAIGLDERVDTVLRNLKHGAPPDGVDALQALRRSSGVALSVTDEEALAWQARIATRDGVFCEPSAAAAGAAVARLVDDGLAGAHDTVVAIVTGSGFREISALEDFQLPQIPADAEPSVLASLAGE